MKTLKILLAACTGDAKRRIRQLFLEAGYETAMTDVGDVPDLETALAKGGWDAILAGDELPDFDVLKALNVLRRRSEDIPFIVVSSKAAVDRIVDVIRAGAQDFIPSHHLHRLVPSLARHLRDAEGRRSDRRVEEARRLDQILHAHHMERLRSLGTLAGGIAHDFNNLLTGVMGYAGIIQRHAARGSVVHNAAETIENAATQAAKLTEQLLGFARRGKHQNVPVDLREVVDQVLALLGPNTEGRIRIKRRYDVEHPVVLGDPTQMQQMFLNLAVNACDAMPDGGELLFEVGERTLDEVYCRRHPGAVPGDCVLVSVTDTGFGIPVKNRERIFEPFFSTKERKGGHGTGMGLAMVYGIVKNHDGTIRVYSEVGQGTTFKVYLPQTGLTAAQTNRAEQSAVPEGRGVVLLVDDEELARRVGADLLGSLGYQVITARNGREAIECYRESGRVDLVVVDMVMPEMGGRDCLRALRRINPDVKAVLATGYGLNGGAQEILDEGAVGFIQKPYQLTTLGKTVQKALSCGPPRGTN